MSKNNFKGYQLIKKWKVYGTASVSNISTGKYIVSMLILFASPGHFIPFKSAF